MLFFRMCLNLHYYQFKASKYNNGLTYLKWLLCPWDSPGKNTGVGCHFLLQRIFPTQESNPYLLRLLHWQADSSTAEPPRKVLHLNGAY